MRFDVYQQLAPERLGMSAQGATYCANFRRIGSIDARDGSAAIDAAKIQWPFCVHPVVQQQIGGYA